jgi:hypothetical protein
MKKIIIALLLSMLAAAALSAQNLNIMTASGKLITGEVIGKDDTAVFVKTSGGKVKTVALAEIKKVFDADTMKDLTDAYRPGAAAATAVPAPETDIDQKRQELEARFKSGAISRHTYMKELGKLLNSAAAAPAAAATPALTVKPVEAAETPRPGIQYETVQGTSGTIELTSPMARTVDKYFGLTLDYITINLLSSSDNTRLKNTLKQFAVGTFDDSTLICSFGFGGSVYVRPFDWFAIGGFYTSSFINQNMQVFRGSEEITGGDGDRYMYIDMPTTAYGVLIRLIPYSSAQAQGADHELAEDFAFGIDLRVGVATLGSISGSAGILDEAAPSGTPAVVDVLTADSVPYLGIELNLTSQDNFMKFAMGYQQFMFNQLNADTNFPGLTNSSNVVADSSGPIPFSGQGFYLTLSVTF